MRVGANGGGEDQGVEHHVQGDGAPDGAAVVVAPGQGQGHGHILEKQQQIAEIHRAVGIDELPDAVKGKNQGGEHIAQHPAVPPGGAEEQAAEQRLLHQGHEHHQDHHCGRRGEGKLLGVALRVGILYRQRNEHDQQMEHPRPDEPGAEGEQVFRQPVQQQVKPVPQERPEDQKDQGSGQEVVDHVGLGHGQFPVESPLHPSHGQGKDRQVQGKEHPPPAHLGAGELRTPWTAFGVHGGGPLFLSEIGVRPGGAGRCGQKVNCPRGAREAALGRRPLRNRPVPRYHGVGATLVVAPRAAIKAAPTGPGYRQTSRRSVRPISQSTDTP